MLDGDGKRMSDGDGRWTAEGVASPNQASLSAPELVGSFCDSVGGCFTSTLHQNGNDNEEMEEGRCRGGKEVRKAWMLAKTGGGWRVCNNCLCQYKMSRRSYVRIVATKI